MITPIKTINKFISICWFEKNQMPMQVYDGYPVVKSDSIMISTGTGNVSFLMTGIFTATGFSGSSRLEKEGSPAKNASFQLQVSNGEIFLPFNYFFVKAFLFLSSFFAVILFMQKKYMTLMQPVSRLIMPSPV